MNNRTKGILLVVVFVAVLAGGFFGYRALSGRYRSKPQAEETQEKRVESADSADGTVEGEMSESTTDAVSETRPESTGTETTGEDELSDAPDFAMIDAEGNTVRLSDLRGKPTVINFWASWCPPCKAELPFFEEAYKEYMERVNFVMLNLTDGSQETVETASSYIATEGYTFPLYFDTQMEGTLAYGTYSIPVTVVVTADGKIFTQRVGSIPTKESLCDMFTSLLEE